MYRTRIERLEERKMFSVTDLIIDPFEAQSVSAATVDEAPAIVDDGDGIAYSDAGRFNLVGDFNGDGLDDLASFTVDSRPELTHLGSTELIHGRSGFLLPYLEQDNLYKSISDGTSNTLMFGEHAPPVDVDLLGLVVHTSPIDLEVSGIDVWEHAYSVPNGPAPSGIIAILIGLAADPTDPSGNTATGANVAFADGSVRFFDADVSGTALLSASLHASDEFFARFSNTTLDDDAALAELLNNGDGTRKLTHDTEFEKWAGAHHSNRMRLEDVLVSSILHEENEFSFPRMFRGGVFVGD